MSGANCHANSAIRNSCWKIFIQWCLHNFVNWQKDIYSGHIEHPNNHRLRNCSNQKERRNNITLAHTVSIQTVTDSIRGRVTSGRQNTSLILVDHGVAVIEGCYRKIMLLYYCPSCVGSQASSSSFSKILPGAHGARGSQLSYRYRQISTDFKNSFKAASAANL